MQESPLTAMVLAATIKHPNYNGTIQYEWLPNAPAAVKNTLNPMDQRAGGWVRSTNAYVKPHITGLRNGFGAIVRREGQFAVANSGPNKGWGEIMVGIGPDLNPITLPDPHVQDGFWTDVAAV